MKNEEDAVKLAELMVDIGKADGKETMAVITDMEQPLGRAVGNSLEVEEAIRVLKNQGPEDITELSLTLAGMMVYLGKKASTVEEGIELAERALTDGSALKKFRDFVSGQGGNPDITEDMGILPSCAHRLELTAAEDGYVSEIDAMRIGLASQHTGAGRQRKEDDIDPAAGLYLHKKVGERVRQGELLCTIYGNNVKKIEKSLEEVKNAVKISRKQPEKNKLIKKIIK